MSDELKGIRTRFRAYTMPSAGSCFSYATDKEFVLIEARAPQEIRDRIVEEMELFQHETISLLHITSWDQDHCTASELEWILDNLKPRKLEYPGYEADNDNSIKCLGLIENYKNQRHILSSSVVRVTPEYVNSLKSGSGYSYKNIIFHPKKYTEKANDNSIVKFFRSGMFNVLSLGDVESAEIATLLKNSSLIEEVDVIILPHHGGHSEVLTKDLLEKIEPSIAVCSSNHSNQYGHPTQDVRNLLDKLDIELYTTKSQDIIIESTGSHYGRYKVYDKKVNKNNEEEAIIEDLQPKKFIELRKHEDNQRKSYKSAIYKPRK
ncbi:ComEC/Rec2 family competence protein [Providencia manganoxydans]|uniref:ComEC/Rec2 family competence protein n=3 Tax=Providencia manganoxydans TaxID=2923283 RepID=UPI003AF3E83E